MQIEQDKTYKLTSKALIATFTPRSVKMSGPTFYSVGIANFNESTIQKVEVRNTGITIFCKGDCWITILADVDITITNLTVVISKEFGFEIQEKEAESE